MKTTLSTLAFAFILIITPSAVSAYNGYVSDIRFGEHPYETRKRDENRRKRLAESFEKHGYYTFDNPVYLHPLYAKKSVLHPFYRKGGTSQFQDGRFARWRGYQDPILAQSLSPDTYCLNFYYQRLPYRGSPVGQECF